MPDYADGFPAWPLADEALKQEILDMVQQCQRTLFFRSVGLRIVLTGDADYRQLKKGANGSSIDAVHLRSLADFLLQKQPRP